MRRAVWILRSGTLLAGVLAAVLAAVGPVAGQTYQRVEGRIVAFGKEDPVANAKVSIVGTREQTLTTEEGFFRFDQVTVGPHVLHIEYMGMTSRDVAFQVAAEDGASLSLALQVNVIPLAELIVDARPYSPVNKLFGFYRRMANGPGYYITREDILRAHPSRPTDLLRRVPGVHIGPILDGRAMLTMSRRRGCIPEYYVDGARAPFYVVDDLQPSDLAGIEIYRGNSEVPVQFKARGHCGAIIIWTREPGSRS